MRKTKCFCTHILNKTLPCAPFVRTIYVQKQLILRTGQINSGPNFFIILEMMTLLNSMQLLQSHTKHQLLWELCFCLQRVLYNGLLAVVAVCSFLTTKFSQERVISNNSSSSKFHNQFTSSYNSRKMPGVGHGGHSGRNRARLRANFQHISAGAPYVLRADGGDSCFGCCCCCCSGASLTCSFDHAFLPHELNGIMSFADYSVMVTEVCCNFVWRTSLSVIKPSLQNEISAARPSPEIDAHARLSPHSHSLPDSILPGLCYDVLS